MFEWEVTVKMDGTERTYTLQAVKSYDARMTAIAQFLEDFNIPGRPYEYFTGNKKGILEVSYKCSVDRRRSTENYEPPAEILSVND